MPDPSDFSLSVEPEAAVPDDLLHRPEDLERTADALASLTVKLQPIAEQAVFEALREQTTEAGASELTDEAKKALTSLLSEPDFLDELAADETAEIDLRTALSAALTGRAHDADDEADGQQILREQVALRAQDVARLTAGALLESSACRSFRILEADGDVGSTDELDRLTRQAIADRGGLDGGQAQRYLDRVQDLLREDSLRRQLEAASISDFYVRVTGG